jgi:hypothetical protein
MTKYVVRVTRTLVVEANSEGEATMMSLYATYYPEYLEGIESLYYHTDLVLNQDEVSKTFEDWPKGQGNQD